MKHFSRVIFVFLFSFSAMAADRVIINPDNNGDLKLKVNKAGVVTDALVITGSTGAVSLNTPLSVASGGSGSASGVTSTAIVDSTIVSADIAADTITAADIAADAIGASELAANAVASSNIVDLTIVNADIAAAAAIDGTKINPSFTGPVSSDNGVFGSGIAATALVASSSGTTCDASCASLADCACVAGVQLNTDVLVSCSTTNATRRCLCLCDSTF